jgi:hypothetical protein
MLKKDDKDFIDMKAKDLNNKDYSVAENISEIISALNAFINTDIDIKDTEIEEYLDTLIGYFTTTLHIPLIAGLKILRARKFNTQYHLEKEVKKLSYISKEKSSDLCEMGRMNRDRESVYYGCIYFRDDNTAGVNVGFSEIDAKPNQIVNVLRSEVNKDLNVLFIGIYDYIFRERCPYFISEDTFNYFKVVYEYQKKAFSDDVFLAHQLCDTFFSDILRKNEHGNLYKITSKLSNLFWEGKDIDGIIYTSVKAEGSPVIAIKTDSVDNKLSHIKADCYEIQKDFGYAFYRAKHTHSGKVNGDSIDWERLAR